MLSRSGNPLLIFLQSYHVWVTSKIQVEFRFKTYAEVLVNVSYRFLILFDYSCFWVQEIHCWYFYRATMFGWPRKSRYTSGSTRTRRYCWLCLVEFWNFFTNYVFEVREFFADIPTELPCLRDLENTGHLLVQEVIKDTQTFVSWQKCSKFISNRAKRRVMVTRPMLNCQLYCHVTSCHIMSHHVTSCLVISRHVIAHLVTSCHVMPHHFTSSHVM